ncbi:MAG: heavy metal-binding domain-containing protein [Phycisphaerales bacterium]
MTRRLLVVAGAGMIALAGCESSTGRTELARGVTPPAEPTAFLDVAVYTDTTPAAYRELGRVYASAEARYEHRIENAERLALAELRKRAGEIGANAIIEVQQEISEQDGQPVRSVSGSFEDSSRDLLRPGGGDLAATRPVYRVRMTAIAVRTDGT